MAECPEIKHNIWLSLKSHFDKLRFQIYVYLLQNNETHLEFFISHTESFSKQSKDNKC